MRKQDIIDKAKTIFQWIYYSLVILFIISLIFSLRLYVSITSISLLCASLIYFILDRQTWLNKSFFNLFTSGCFFYVIIQGIALFYTQNVKAGWVIEQINLGLIGLPLAVSYCDLINKNTYPRIMKWYVFILLAAIILALINAFRIYLMSGSTGQFFYHPLVHIYSNHAIQFSVLVFVGIVFLLGELEHPTVMKNRLWIIFLLIVFSLFLFLLTSKLILIVSFIYLIYLLLSSKKVGNNRSYKIFAGIAVVALFTVFLTTSSPLKKRMAEDAGSSLSVLSRGSFTPGEYFTGVQFRLLSWRFVYEILSEKHKWITGVTPGDAQETLNNKYREMNMFIGGAPENKTGYLGYHTHNQFLQALLETGILGLTAFIVICAGMFRLAFLSGNRSLFVLTILLICYCFTDAILETQYGVVLFAWFPLFIYRGLMRSHQEA